MYEMTDGFADARRRGDERSIRFYCERVLPYAILDRPGLLLRRAEQLTEEAAEKEAALTAQGIQYDAGGLGCRVQTTPMNTTEAKICALADLHKEKDAIMAEYLEACEELRASLDEYGGLKDRERQAVIARYTRDRDSRSYKKIYARCGYNTEAACRQAVKRAVDKYSAWVYETKWETLEAAALEEIGA